MERDDRGNYGWHVRDDRAEPQRHNRGELREEIEREVRQEAKDERQDERLKELEGWRKDIDITLRAVTPRIRDLGDADKVIRKELRRLDQEIGEEDEDWSAEVDEMLDAWRSIRWAWRILRKHPKLAKWVPGLGVVLAGVYWIASKLGITLPG